MIQWKLGCRSWKQKLKNPPIAKLGVGHCHWVILPLLLAAPRMKFSLDHKRRSHKQNQCSASDSVSLIFTRSCRSTLLITTPTTTPSVVKTSLKNASYSYRMTHLEKVVNFLSYSNKRREQQPSSYNWCVLFNARKRSLTQQNARALRARVECSLSSERLALFIHLRVSVWWYPNFHGHFIISLGMARKKLSVNRNIATGRERLLFKFCWLLTIIVNWSNFNTNRME